MKTNARSIVAVGLALLGGHAAQGRPLQSAVIGVRSSAIHPASAALLLPATGGTAPKSGLPGFDTWEMPDGALRLAEVADVQALTAKLKEYAAENGLTLSATEALVWMNEGRDDYHNKDTEISLMSTFSGAGFTVKESGQTGDPEYRFVARGSGGRAASGIWAVRDGYLALVWGSIARQERDKPAASSPDSAVAPTGPAADILPSDGNNARPVTGTGTGHKIAVPAALASGVWSWTTIGGVGYVNSTTGQMAAPSGMSARFTFNKDGRYTYMFYIRQQTYGLVSEATTNESGAATFQDDGTVVLAPARGHYKGSTGSRLIDRDMTVTERKPKTFYWEWRTENGRRRLYLGPARSALSLFNRA